MYNFGFTQFYCRITDIRNLNEVAIAISAHMDTHAHIDNK